MEAVLTNILNVVPGWLALVLMLGGFAFYVLGAIRLGYGATVRPLVLDLIERAEHEIQGTKRGAERKAWVAAKLRAARCQQEQPAHSGPGCGLLGGRRTGGYCGRLRREAAARARWHRPLPEGRGAPDAQDRLGARGHPPEQEPVDAVR